MVLWTTFLRTDALKTMEYETWILDLHVGYMIFLQTVQGVLNDRRPNPKKMFYVVRCREQ